jgi:hypothetical protein
MILPERFNDLEINLESALRPIHANPEFVHRLGRQLVTPPGAVLERQSSAIGLLLIALGLVGGVLVLVGGRWLFRWLTSDEGQEPA